MLIASHFESRKKHCKVTNVHFPKCQLSNQLTVSDFCHMCDKSAAGWPSHYWDWTLQTANWRRDFLIFLLPKVLWAFWDIRWRCLRFSQVCVQSIMLKDIAAMTTGMLNGSDLRCCQNVKVNPLLQYWVVDNRSCDVIRTWRMKPTSSVATKLWSRLELLIFLSSTDRACLSNGHDGITTSGPLLVQVGPRVDDRDHAPHGWKAQLMNLWPSSPHNPPTFSVTLLLWSALAKDSSLYLVSKLFEGTLKLVLNEWSYFE